MGGFGDLGGGVVADFGGERGDQHQGIVDVMIDLVAIDFDALDAVGYEAVHGVGEKFDAMEIVEDDDGLENVELEIALRAGETDGGVVAHHLDGDHGDGFGLRGFTLPGMMLEPGSFSGSESSPRPQRGPEASQRMSLAIFMSEAARVFSAPLAKTNSSWALSAANLLGCERKGNPVSSAIFFAARSANSGWALSPVPTAVPPMARS